MYPRKSTYHVTDTGFNSYDIVHSYEYEHFIGIEEGFVTRIKREKIGSFSDYVKANEQLALLLSQSDDRYTEPNQ